MKKALLLTLTCLSTTLAAPAPCPTCPKGYAVSSLEEALLPKVQKKENSEISSAKTAEVQESTPIKEATQATSVHQMTSNAYRTTETSSPPTMATSAPAPHSPKRREILSGAKAVGIPVGNSFDSLRPSMQQGTSGGFDRRR